MYSRPQWPHRFRDSACRAVTCRLFRRSFLLLRCAPVLFGDLRPLLKRKNEWHASRSLDHDVSARHDHVDDLAVFVIARRCIDALKLFHHASSPVSKPHSRMMVSARHMAAYIGFWYRAWPA